MSVTNLSVIPVSVALPIGMYSAARVNDNYYDENASVILAASELTNILLSQSTKLIFKRKRPFRIINNVNLFETLSVAGTYSFPSGHASESFTIATSLTLSYPGEPALIAALYTYAAVTSLGRIYWGVHYPSDVLAGALIGSASAALVYSLRKPLIQTKDKLFNQQDRNYSEKNNLNTPVLLMTVIGTDVINFFLSKSSSRVLKNSRLNFTTTADRNYFNCIYNFNF